MKLPNGSKRVFGILVWLLGSILKAKGVVDDATGTIIQDTGMAVGAAGVVHAQVKKANATAKATSGGGTGGTS